MAHANQQPPVALKITVHLIAWSATVAIVLIQNHVTQVTTVLLAIAVIPAKTHLPVFLMAQQNAPKIPNAPQAAIANSLPTPAKMVVEMTMTVPDNVTVLRTAVATARICVPIQILETLATHVQAMPIALEALSAPRIIVWNV